MYTDWFFSGSATVVTAIFSLVSLVIGILIGTQIDWIKKPTGKKMRARPKRAPARKRGGSKAGAGTKGDTVELYVGNLAYGVRERDLSSLFGDHGNVTRIRIIKNRSNGKSKGYGFVEMEAGPKIDAAVRALNGTEVKGRKIVVNEAKSRS